MLRLGSTALRRLASHSRLPLRVAASPLVTLSSARLSRTMTTTTAQSASPAPLTITTPPSAPSEAPSPFIVAKGNPLDSLLPGYVKVPASDNLPAYAVFGGEIEKSPNDDRAYRLILLPNGMEALIISDPSTDKASAALDVKVGHLSDPEDIPGLAHFCEHLMFMGTKKYPGENEYTEFLTRNSGTSNAFTGNDQTNYYFDCHPSALTEALDRFAQFFIAPVFDPACSEREANAVNSENSKNLQSDMWRMFQLDKSTSSREHSFWRFGTGDKETLWNVPISRGEDVRARLIEWQEKHYSANLMKLCVLGKDSLDDLAKTVVEQFSPSPNRHLPVPNFPGNPLGEKELKTTIILRSVKDQRILDITFPFPDESPLYATKPGSFLSHLIGHEGPGSVLSYLKGKGWANGISAGAGNGATGFMFFKIHVDLTAEGLASHEDVSQAVFAYIELLKSTPPQKWAFDEVNVLSEMSFRFKEKSPPTSTSMALSMQMSRPYPRSKLLSAPYSSPNWSPEIIKNTTAILSAENCRIMIASQDGADGKVLDLKEQWYGTEYTIVPTSETVLKGKSPAAYPELALPKPNSFIPANLDIKNKVEVDEPAKRPLSIRNTPISRVWYKKDDRWWVPRAGAFFLLRSPLVDDSPINAVQSRFATELIRDSLQEYAYDAELAGLSYSFDSQADGIVLTIDGYNDKLAVLAEVVFKAISSLKVDPKRFDIIKDQLKRAFANNKLDQPYSHAGFQVLHLTQATLWTHEERLLTIDGITVEGLQSYITDLLARLHIEILVHGNMLKDEALELANIAEKTLAPQPLTPQELLSHQALIVPEGKHLCIKPVPNSENANSSIEQFTYVGDIMDVDLRNKLSLFGHLVQEPLFDDLRTKQQLGYIVSSGPRRSLGFMGLRVIVQSERDAAYVEGCVDKFWEEYKVVLDEMTEEDFNKHKESVVNQKLEDHKNMWQECVFGFELINMAARLIALVLYRSSNLWLNIHSGYYAFTQRQADAELTKKLTKADIQAFFHQYFFDSPEHRIRRLSAHLQSQKLQADALVALLPSLEALDVEVDKAQFGMFAQSKPTLESLKTFTAGFLASKGKSPEVIEEFVASLDKLAEPSPVPEGVKLITDVEAFRAEAERAPHAYPVAEYADLFPKL
ncbi:insulysin, partial [Phenoliferia sp. Uapishka_3]